MSLVLDVNDLILALTHLERKARLQQNIYWSVINNVVRMHQKYRLAKHYAVSDELRDILNRLGISIIQGTAGYKYEEIPDALRGRMFDDTWELK